jgi:hypothetical protein
MREIERSGPVGMIQFIPIDKSPFGTLVYPGDWRTEFFQQKESIFAPF